MNRFLFFVLTLASFAYAQTEQSLDINETLIKERQEKERKANIVNLQEKIAETQKFLKKEGVLWQKSYHSYVTYLEVAQELNEVRKEIKKLSKHGSSFEARDELNALETREQILAKQIDLLQGKENAPFKDLIIPDELPEPPEITNPISIFTALSYIKLLEGKESGYKQRESNLREYIVILRKKTRLEAELSVVSKNKLHEDIYLENMHMLGIFDGFYDVTTCRPQPEEFIRLIFCHV